MTDVKIDIVRGAHLRDEGQGWVLLKDEGQGWWLGRDADPNADAGARIVRLRPAYTFMVQSVPVSPTQAKIVPAVVMPLRFSYRLDKPTHAEVVWCARIWCCTLAPAEADILAALINEAEASRVETAASQSKIDLDVGGPLSPPLGGLPPGLPGQLPPGFFPKGGRRG